MSRHCVVFDSNDRLILSIKRKMPDIAFTMDDLAQFFSDTGIDSGTCTIMLDLSEQDQNAFNGIRQSNNNVKLNPSGNFAADPNSAWRSYIDTEHGHRNYWNKS